MKRDFSICNWYIFRFDSAVSVTNQSPIRDFPAAIDSIHVGNFQNRTDVKSNEVEKYAALAIKYFVKRNLIRL